MYKMDNETKFIEFLQAARKPNDKDCLASDFLRHIIKEPQFYAAFEHYTYQMIRRGRDFCSPWMVANRVRWESHLKTDEKYKVRNDYIALYARLFMARNIQYHNFFKTKPMKRIKGL